VEKTSVVAVLGSHSRKRSASTGALDENVDSKRSRRDESKTTKDTTLQTLIAVHEYWLEHGFYPNEYQGVDFELFTPEVYAKMAMYSEKGLVKAKKRHKTAEHLNSDIRVAASFHTDFLQPCIARKDEELAEKGRELAEKEHQLSLCQYQLYQQHQQHQGMQLLYQQHQQYQGMQPLQLLYQQHQDPLE
jgi:hypothetical protein